VTLRARWVMLRARWVNLRARWVTLRARWVTLRACWATLRARWVTFRCATLGVVVAAVFAVKHGVASMRESAEKAKGSLSSLEAAAAGAGGAVTYGTFAKRERTGSVELEAKGGLLGALAPLAAAAVHL
jgi:hypothetical protein